MDLQVSYLGYPEGHIRLMFKVWLTETLSNHHL